MFLSERSDDLLCIYLFQKGLMVCGVDTFHDSPSHRKNSVAALVCSINNECTRYYSRVHYQQPGEELVNGLKVRSRRG